VQLEGFSPGALLCPLLMNSHSPHSYPTPGVYTFTFTQSIRCFTSLALGFNNRSNQNSQSYVFGSYVVGVGLSLGEDHFPTNSLTWREFLTDLTTFLFNHGLTTCFFNQFQLNSRKVRTITIGQYNSGK
jgi:hypothetical protein